MRYDDQYGELLTWIFMWDKALQHPLKGSVELLKDGFEVGLHHDGDSVTGAVLQVNVVS